MAAYATLAELKVFLRITDATDDVLLQLALDSATTLIDKALDTETVQLSPVPSIVKLACELQAERLYKRRDAPFGVLGSQEFGNYTRLQAALDPDVQLMISGYGQRKRYGTAF
jgi:phage gp36-like protein